MRATRFSHRGNAGASHRNRSILCRSQGNGYRRKCFTTHTPVPAGNEQFDPALVLRYLRPYLDRVGLTNDDFLRYGSHPGSTAFSMTVFALNFSRKANGVSRLHGQVSRKIWKDVWPRLPESEVPIGPRNQRSSRRNLGFRGDQKTAGQVRGSTSPVNPLNEDFWKKIDRIPDSELWRAHERLRARLVGYARKKWDRQLEEMGIRGLPTRTSPFSTQTPSPSASPGGSPPTRGPPCSSMTSTG